MANEQREIRIPLGNGYYEIVRQTRYRDGTYRDNPGNGTYLGSVACRMCGRLHSRTGASTCGRCNRG